MNKRKKIATFVCIISVVPLISLQILSPRIDNSSFWDSLAMVFCILINVIMMNRQRRIYKVSLITAVLVFLVFVYALFTSSMQVSLKYAISFLILLSPIYLSNYIIKDSIDELDVKKYKIIILVITIELIFCLIMSLAYLKIDPMAMRNMASDAGQINFFSAIGGGYKLVFCSILLVALSAYIFKSKIYLGWKALALISYVFLLYFLFKSDVVTAFLLAIWLSLPIIFRNKDINHKAFYMVSFAVVIITYTLLVDVIYDFAGQIASLFDNDSYLYIRLNELQFGDSSFEDRLERMQKSIETFVEYPLFGVGIRVGFDYYSLANMLGMHSDFVDIPGKYGLIFTSILYTVFYLQYKRIKVLFQTSNHQNFYTLVSLSVVITSLFDPVLSTNMLMILYVYIPLILLCDEKNSFIEKKVVTEAENNSLNEDFRKWI